MIQNRYPELERTRIFGSLLVSAAAIFDEYAAAMRLKADIALADWSQISIVLPHPSPEELHFIPTQPSVLRRSSRNCFGPLLFIYTQQHAVKEALILFAHW